MMQLCECGCGEPAPLAQKTNKKRGWGKGEPIRFIRGHNESSFKKGYIPWNKGLKGTCFSSTQFKKGEKHSCWLPVGTIKIRTKGGKRRKYIKTDNSLRLIEYARHIWTSNNGDIPKGLVIHHIDGNTMNDHVDNLAMLTKKAHFEIHEIARLGIISRKIRAGIMTGLSTEGQGRPAKNRCIMVIGIDPGLKGGICLAWKLASWDVCPMPVTGGGLDLRQLKTILTPAGMKQAELVVIEKVHSMPKQGVVSSFKFGDGFGSLKTACVFLDLPFILVTPQQWKKTVLAGYDWKGNKDTSIVWVKQRYPGLSLRPTERSRVDSHGLADAVCLAQYGIDSMR